MSAADIFDQLAQEDTQRIQQGQPNAQPSNAKDIFDQLAANDGQLTPPPPPPGTPTMGPGPSIGLLDKISQTEVPGTGVTLGEAGNRAQDFMKMAGEESLALFGGPEGGIPSAFAQGGRAGQAIVGASKFAHIFDEGETSAVLAKIGKIPGILKSAYDWTTANPVKAYILYRIADQAGIGLSGVKKLFHLVSSGEE